MISNREQLITMASEWVNMAKNDLRSKIISFIEESGVSKSQLAHILAVSEGEIEQIINGNGEITLSTFAKLLIATDNVIEIKPLSETPFGSMENMPNPTEMPNPMMGGGMPFNGRPMREMSHPMMGGGIPYGGRPMREMPNTEMDERKPRKPMSFMSEMPQMNERAHEEFDNCEQMPNGCYRKAVNLDELNKHELANIIIGNHWDREINIAASSRTELIDFLEYKQSMMESMRPTQKKKKHNTESMTRCSEDVTRITKFLTEEVKRNPNLRKIVNQYLEKR